MPATRFPLILILLAGLSGPMTWAGAQSLDFLVGNLVPTLGIPLGDSATTWSVGGGGDLEVHYAFPGSLGILSQFQPFVAGTVQAWPNTAQKTLAVAGAGLGIEFSQFFIPRFGFGVTGSFGLYNGNYGGVDSANWYFSAGADLRFRLTPALALSLGATYQYFRSTDQALVEGLAVRLGIRLNVGGLQDGDNLEIKKLDTSGVFPVLYSQYDKNSLGHLSFRNREDGAIQNVQVTFFMKQYMDQPKQCLLIPEVAKDQTVEADLYALLNTNVLKLIESTKTQAEVSIQYEFLGTKRLQRIDVPMVINNRNAMSWDDDRKAAAFVSSKDPAVLRYSKYLAGLIRENTPPGMNQDLRFAIGMFEGLKLMGINYVVDPTTPYSDFSENATSVDFLQFPFQTLTYKGGDCDDLSILFASVMASVGIPSAFITIPGHIYVAFSPNISAREAQDMFPDMKDLIVQDGRIWIPVEITLLKSSFSKAWSIGVQEWRDNPDAKLLPIQNAWQLFDPVSPPDQDTRVTLPSDREVVDQVKSGIDRFTAQVLPLKVAALTKELAASAARERVLNRLGILYARFGKFKEAKDSFAQAGKAGFPLADTNIGNVALLQKDYAGARTSFEKSLRANPTDSATLLGLAITFYETELYDLAAAQYEKLRQINPELADQYDFLSTKKAQAAPAADTTEEAKP